MAEVVTEMEEDQATRWHWGLRGDAFDWRSLTCQIRRRPGREKS